MMVKLPDGAALTVVIAFCKSPNDVTFMVWLGMAVGGAFQASLW
jgi:hypothetical protein